MPKFSRNPSTKPPPARLTVMLLGIARHLIREKRTMRVISTTIAAAFLLAAPTLAASLIQATESKITCTHMPEWQRFNDNLKPFTTILTEQQHLDAAKQAANTGNDRKCVSGLGRVNEYATRSAAADKRAATHHTSAH